MFENNKVPNSVLCVNSVHNTYLQIEFWTCSFHKCIGRFISFYKNVSFDVYHFDKDVYKIFLLIHIQLNT